MLVVYSGARAEICAEVRRGSAGIRLLGPRCGELSAQPLPSLLVVRKNQAEICAALLEIELINILLGEYEGGAEDDVGTSDFNRAEAPGAEGWPARWELIPGESCGRCHD